VNSFSAKEIKSQAKEIGFSNIYSSPFAGFASRIFYWLMDPISQKTSNRLYHNFIDGIISALSIIDNRLLRFFVPADWFDEFFISMEKQNK